MTNYQLLGGCRQFQSAKLVIIACFTCIIYFAPMQLGQVFVISI